MRNPQKERARERERERGREGEGERERGRARQGEGERGRVPRLTPRHAKAYAEACQGLCLGMPWLMPRHTFLDA